MERWRKILSRWGPREDVGDEFYPDGLDVERPVLINTMGPLAAALVAARLLRAVVARGGSVVAPSAVKKLEALLSRGMSQDVVHHCQAEAERILDWIDRCPSTEESAGDADSDLGLMMAADLQSRLSVAHFALEEGYDLELEYYDESSRSWPRIRACLQGIDGAESADFDTCLRLRDSTGEFLVPLKYVRWLMPVSPDSIGDGGQPGSEGGGDVLPFPRRGDDKLPDDNS